MAQIVTLPDELTADQYEHLSASCLAIGGYFVEKNIRERIEKRDFQELDVCGWRWKDASSETLLAEAKSGGWHKKEFFSILGKRVYLNITHGLLIHRKQNDPDPVYAAALEKLHPHQIGAVFLDSAASDETLVQMIVDTCGADYENVALRILDLHSLPAWRYSFWLEKSLLESLVIAHKGNPDSTCLDEAKSLFELTNSRFFVADARAQALLLWEHYDEHSKLTRRLIEEARVLEIFAELAGLSDQQAFWRCAYDGQIAAVQACLYLEHWSRCLILRAAVETLLLRDSGGILEDEGRNVSIDYVLPDYFDQFCQYARSIKEVHLLPQLWQTYIFTWGGFLIEDDYYEEIDLIGREIGMSDESVHEGLQAFDHLFPGVSNGWHVSLEGTGLQILKMVPSPFRGLGVQRRRWLKGDGAVPEASEEGRQ